MEDLFLVVISILVGNIWVEPNIAGRCRDGNSYVYLMGIVKEKKRKE